MALATGLLAACAMVAQPAALDAGGSGLGPLVIELPSATASRGLAAYLGVSYLAPVPASSRPTPEQRFEAPPFHTGPDGVTLQLDTLDEGDAHELLRVANLAHHPPSIGYQAFVHAGEQASFRRSSLPDHRSELERRIGFEPNVTWTSVVVASLVVHDRRRLWYSLPAILEAGARALETGSALVYAPGTCFLAEDLDAAGHVLETHVLSKRVDQEWDFAVYDQQGVRRPSSAVSPQVMRPPDTCFTCHQMAGNIPPFSDFPEESARRRDGQPAVLINLTPAEKALVKALAAPSLRGDQIHGTYLGLAVLRARALAAADSLPPVLASLLARIQQHLPPVPPAPPSAH